MIVRFDTHRRGSRYTSTSFAVVSLAAWRLLYPILYEAGTHFSSSVLFTHVHGTERRRPAVRWLRRAILVLACAELLQWRFHHTITELQQPPSARCILLALSISHRRGALFHVQTRRDHGHAMRVRTSSPEFTEALGAAAFGIDGQRLIKIKVGATRTNQHDEH